MSDTTNHISTSIIIPCYIETRWLPNAIQSALTQGPERNQIIVVDDGNPSDEIEKICKEFNSPSILYLKTAHKGSAAARNAGLAKAEGKYIKFLDADDTLPAKTLHQQVQYLEQNNIDGVYSDFCMNHLLFDTFFICKPAIISGPRSNLLASLLRRNWIALGAFLYRKELFNRHLIQWDERYCINDDFAFNSYVFATGATFHYIPVTSYHYRKYSNDTLSTKVEVSKDAKLEFLNSTLKALKQLDDKSIIHQNSETKSSLAWCYLWLSEEWYEFDRSISLELKNRSHSISREERLGSLSWFDLEKLSSAQIATFCCKQKNYCMRLKKITFSKLYIEDFVELLTFLLRSSIRKFMLLVRNYYL